MYVKVTIPDGDKCDNCRFQIKGTVLCGLFDEFLEEIDDYTNMAKCKQCKKYGIKDDGNDE